MTLEIIDLLMRGGAIALALFSAAAMYARYPKEPIGWASLAAAAGCSAYLLESTPALKGTMLGPLVLLYASCPTFVWWLCNELLDNGHWPRRLVLPLAAFFVGSFLLGQSYDALLYAHVLVAIGLNLHLLYVAQTGRAGDLIEARQQFRWWLIVVTVLIGLSVSAVEIVLNLMAPPVWLLPLQAAAVLMAITGYAVFKLCYADQLVATPETAAAKPVAVLGPAEQAVLERLQRAMRGGAWQQEGLTIGALAEQLETSEHRLRRVINQGLGHRNFAAFVNGYRVRAAQARLADPSEAETSVLALAHDVGFASLGPFNRAFREITGESPSTFRARALVIPEDLAPIPK